MSSDLPFVPRAVSKTKKFTKHHPRNVANIPLASLPPRTPTTPESAKDNGRGKERVQAEVEESVQPRFSDEDYVSLVCLSLSDYSLWLDADLRRKVEQSQRSGRNADGFIPLSYVIKTSRFLAPLHLDAHMQMQILKALRNHAADYVDVRLCVHEASTWRYGRQDNPRQSGGYEIRRKGWSEQFSGEHKSHLTKGDWEDRTIYAERIPIQYRTVSSIAKFLLHLLPEPSDSSHRLERIQDVSFIPHHQDKPGDQATCKGFALIVFKDPSDVRHMLRVWPWDRQPHRDAKRADDSHADEARKFGFRATSKTHWSELRQEYLGYRGKLVDEIAAFEDATAPEPLTQQPESVSLSTETREREAETVVEGKEPLGNLSPTSPYPPHTLIFVRNIHIGTNKTTLRKLFAQAFRAAISRGELASEGLDYVDYNKGMDACHLRVATPNHASILIEHFSKNQIAQKDGLDETGSMPPGDGKPITLELVTGKREELYWEQVPEKVRRQAVQKALEAVNMSTATSEDSRKRKEDEDGAVRRKRKKARH